MGLETGSFVADFVPANPVAGDGAGQGDDHLRLIKDCVQRTFPNFGNVFHKVQLRSTGLAIPATDNTSRFVIDNSATTTVTLSLPAAASITAGFVLLVTPLTGATALIDPDGVGTINGSTQLSVGDRNTAFVYYTGTSWLADVFPSGENGHIFHGTLGVSASASFNSTLRVSGTASFASPIHADGGQIRFPAAQNASADGNTLDDYEEGTWTPTLTFDTPGNLSVTYSFNTGTYNKVGRQVTVYASISTTAFTHTTASGALRISGLPFAGSAAHQFAAALFRFEGIVVAGNDMITAGVEAGASTIVFRDSGVDAGSSDFVDNTEAVTGTNKVIFLSVTYHV